MPVKSRPGFQTNVDRTSKGVARGTVYLDIKPDQSLNLRFTPTSNEDGDVFFESAQHFKFKHEGEKRAFACLRVHGNADTGTECPICEALEAAEATMTKKDFKKFADLHKQSLRWHAQVIPVYPEDAPKADQTFIIGLSQTTAQKVSKILKNERDMRQPLLTDPDEGQIIQISRTGSGFNTEYDVLPLGVRVSLDTLLPTWESKFLNTEKALKLRVEERATLLESMEETFGAALFQELGIE